MNWQDLDDRISTADHFANETFNEDFVQLRREDPVHWTDGCGSPKPFWSITTHANCIHVLEDQDTFSSEFGGVMPLTAEDPTPQQRHALGFDSIPTFLDPPRHQKMRRPFNKHFAAPAIARLKSAVESAVQTIIDDVLPLGHCDFVNDVAGPLPAYLVCEMMGVPAKDRDKIRHYCAAFMGAQDPEYQLDGGELETQRQMMTNLFAYLLELALDRRQRPSDDFSSLIGNMTLEDDKFSERDVGWWCFALVAAGLETTRSALSIGFLELLRNPEQAELLRGNPLLAPVAAEEFVRFGTPGRQKFRVATRDYELGGKTIRRGDWVSVWLSSGNRDETVFENPDKLVVSRSPNPHIGFGAGGHSCLGRHLARLEMQTMIIAILDRMPDLALAGEYAWIKSVNTSGLKTMPVSFATH